MTARLALVIAWLCARFGPHVPGRCGCSACNKAERDARAAIGMPVRHPERITNDLPAGQEEWLASLATALWPADEYAAIIAELWRKGLR